MIKYKTVDTRTLKGLRRAERLKQLGWKILGSGFWTIDFYKPVSLKQTGLPVKQFKVEHNIGKGKYVVSFHDGVSQHKDGSKFFDMRIFKNKKKLKKFTDELVENNYLEV